MMIYIYKWIKNLIFGDTSKCDTLISDEVIITFYTFKNSVYEITYAPFFFESNAHLIKELENTINSTLCMDGCEKIKGFKIIIPNNDGVGYKYYLSVEKEG